MYKEDDMAGSVEDRKLFVGGLGWNANEKELNDHFSKYGTIESISVKTNPSTGRSRGFAFIVFAKSDSVDQVLNEGEHFINGRKIDPKKAIAKMGKLFVGGLRAELSDEDIKKYFSQFGRIIDIKTPYDHHKNHRKGFCFITFEDEQVVQELLKLPFRTINGVEVDLRKVMPKAAEASSTFYDKSAVARGGYQGYGNDPYSGYYNYNSYSGYSGNYNNDYDYNTSYDQAYSDGHGSRDSHQPSRYQPY